ncbi:MAG: hypothetical protein HY403_01520 [Elusimicrobia bacterium]|nr:hypothetical protein [Elusimicrobiota bacterium]
MAGATGGRGGLGWAILAVSLAVPGVLFYNWWSHLKAEREKTVAAKARGRVPDGGVFESSPNAKLVNPMAPIVSTASAAAPTPTPALEAAAPAAAAAAPGAPGPTFASSMTAEATLKRDPTLSPYDRMRLEEAARGAAGAKSRGKKQKSAVNPAALVDLQGIISNSEGGFKAIVNNEAAGAGEFIGRTKVRIVKITELSVTFDYQGKRFSKGISRD